MVVFFDIDGTIIDESSQQIPASTVRAVEKLRENGHISVINTGRPYSHIDSRIPDMAFRGYACACGMELKLDGKWLVRAYPDRALRERIVAVSRRYRMNSFYELVDGGLMADDLSRCPPFMVAELERMSRRGFPLLKTVDCRDVEFLKLVTFLTDDSDPAGFTAELSDVMEITDRGGGMYELVMRGYSKAGGVMRMAQCLGAAPGDTLAIGDSTNDLPMMRFAGHSVCMGNGMQIVKDSCEFVTASVMEDGIEKALQHYGLI